MPSSQVPNTTPERRTGPVRGDSKLELAIAVLGNLSREELTGRWERVYGSPPPKGLGRGLLEKAAAWHLQRKMFGGFSPEGRRALNLAIRDFEQQLDTR